MAGFTLPSKWSLTATVFSFPRPLVISLYSLKMLGSSVHCLMLFIMFIIPRSAALFKLSSIPEFPFAIRNSVFTDFILDSMFAENLPIIGMAEPYAYIR